MHMSSLASELALNTQTRKSVGAYLTKPAHALLVLGPEGSGKTTLAKVLAAELLKLNSSDKLASHPFFRHLVKPADKQSIPIEQVRGALSETNLKNPKSSGHASRVIFIEDASKLGADAQNVLLKDLEEPTTGTFFIITAHSARDVLPTIASRCQKLKVAPLSLPDAIAFFDGYHVAEVNSAWALAGGAAGTISSLLENSEQHELRFWVNEVKVLMGETAYEKILFLEKLSSERGKLQDYLLAQQKILAALHRSAIKHGNDRLADRLLAKRSTVDKLSERLQANANTRLIAVELALQV